MTIPGLNVALFIDADNAPSRKLAGVLKVLEKIGTVSIRRAYGNWASANLSPWRKVLHEHAIQPIQQFDLTKGKNATDMAMTIDVMDVLYNKSVDVFCLMSSDSDFTPLIMRLRGDGKQVFGFGGPQSPAPFISACSKFHYLEASTKTQAKPLPEPAAFAAPAVGASDAPGAPENSDINPATAAEPDAVPVTLPKPYVKHTRDELDAVPGLKTLLIDSVCKVGSPGEWVTLSSVGAHLPKLNVKIYGYPKLVQLMEQFSVFEIKRENTHPLIRMKAMAPYGTTAVAV